MKIQIVVAAHKAYWMPDDPLYMPVQAGSAGKPSICSDWRRDDTGENISARNPNYCELTVLYWAWKNIDADAIGLVHYRRYFASRLLGNSRMRIAKQSAIERSLRGVDAVLPRKRHYWIETNYSQYVHAHSETEMTIARQLLAESHSDFLPIWDRVMKRRCGHRFNMFVFRKAELDAYCQWLFPFLFELEARLKAAGRLAGDARTLGFVSERMLDIWLEQSRITYAEMSVAHLESQHWVQKIWAFLSRKVRYHRQPPELSNERRS